MKPDLSDVEFGSFWLTPCTSAVNAIRALLVHLRASGAEPGSSNGPA